MSRIMEFMGLPGSGKSTMALVLLKEMRKQGVELLSNEEAVIRCIRHRDDGMLRNFLKRFPFTLWEPVAGARNALGELHEFTSTHTAFFELLFEILNRRPIPVSWRQCILFAFFKKCVERQLIDRHLSHSDRVIIEEGFALGILTLLDCLPSGTPCEGDIERYIRHMPLPFVLFWIEAEPAECASRLRRRPEMPMLWANYKDSELLEKLEYGRHCLNVTAAKLDQQGVKVLRIKNPDGGAIAAMEEMRKQADQLAQAIVKH